MEKLNIRHISTQELSDWLVKQEEPKYRLQQITDWLWKKGVSKIDDMNNISEKLREKLKQNFVLDSLKISKVYESQDGTQKFQLQTFDGHFIECVLIPTETRLTVCVSSQIGCSLSCKFCATGKIKIKRNLFFDEILDQLFIVKKVTFEKYGKNISNIVFMGMGEPLLNYKNVVKAIEYINNPECLGMSARRITLSTAGIAKMIKQLGDDNLGVNLALSLHATNDNKRNQIMEINESNNLKSLIEALNYFYQQTKTKATLEYILLNKVNDSIEDAKELVHIYRKTPCDLINIIEYNSVDGIQFTKPQQKTFDTFSSYLSANKVNVRIRQSRGKDIAAACGQLANKK